MESLAAAALVFVGSHLVIPDTPLRGWLLARLGPRGYRAAYSLVALASLVWLVRAYSGAPYVGLWGNPVWARWLAIAVMPASLALVVGSFGSGNPTSVAYREGAFDPRRGGIFAITRHPMMWGLALWAAVHVVAVGDVASLILFGSLGALALIGPLAIDARKRRNDPRLWAQLAATTSNLPFGALLAARARLEPRRLLVPALGGIILWAVLLALHGPVLGVSPLP
jgi:uncharacterized membrane protein